MLKAVNLGDDTDTTGAVAGGLAGIYYGADNIPHKWLTTVAKREYIEQLCTAFEGCLSRNVNIDIMEGKHDASTTILQHRRLL